MRLSMGAALPNCYICCNYNILHLLWLKFHKNLQYMASISHIAHKRQTKHLDQKSSQVYLSITANYLMPIELLYL